MPSGDRYWSQWIAVEGLIAAEDLDEGAFAGGIHDEVDLFEGAGQGSEQGTQTAGQVQVV